MDMSWTAQFSLPEHSVLGIANVVLAMPRAYLRGYCAGGAVPCPGTRRAGAQRRRRGVFLGAPESAQRQVIGGRHATSSSAVAVGARRCPATSRRPDASARTNA